jgi:hypothetical protein
MIEVINPLAQNSFLYVSMPSNRRQICTNLKTPNEQKISIATGYDKTQGHTYFLMFT